ncbi:MAG: universal stress protein [Actinomycetota bacterium]|nr:universal stress protein [Actinomycetota bacterium]
MAAERLSVLVGVDGSEGADQALSWAAEEARSRGVGLRLICAYGGEFSYGGLTMFGDFPVPDLTLAREGTADLLAEAAARVTELAPEVEVSAQPVEDDPADALIEASAGASLIVLGARHLAGAGSVVLGSVSSAVAAHAACPVVVLRGPEGSAAEHAQVVVGVDGRPSSEAVLAFAFDYAARHSAPLHAVLCWHLDRLAEMKWRPQQPAPAEVQAWLSEALAGWRERYPDVTVHSGVERAHPVDGLVAASNGQDLLVVGSRGRHGLTRALLGSVSQGALHHANCPVAVVPSLAP